MALTALLLYCSSYVQILLTCLLTYFQPSDCCCPYLCLIFNTINFIFLRKASVTDKEKCKICTAYPLIATNSRHWLRSPERIDFKLAVLVYRCLHGLAPRYLSDHIQLVADSNRRRLRSSSSMQLAIRRTRLSTVGDRAFPVTGCRLWNSLPPDVTSAPTLTVFRNRLKTHLFSRSFPA